MDKIKNINKPTQYLENKSYGKKSEKRWNSDNKRLEWDVSNPTYGAQFQPLWKDKQIKTKVQNISRVCWSFKSRRNEHNWQTSMPYEP